MVLGSPSPRPGSDPGYRAAASRPSPVSNRQAVQSPSGASAKISAPHFRQTLGALLICGESSVALPIVYCAEFYHTLRSQHSDQMAQLIFDIAGNGNSVTDFFAQQNLITVAKPMEGLPKCIIRHAQL